MGRVLTDDERDRIVKAERTMPTLLARLRRMPVVDLWRLEAKARQIAVPMNNTTRAPTAGAMATVRLISAVARERTAVRRAETKMTRAIRPGDVTITETGAVEIARAA